MLEGGGLADPILAEKGEERRRVRVGGPGFQFFECIAGLIRPWGLAVECNQPGKCCGDPTGALEIGGVFGQKKRVGMIHQSGIGTLADDLLSRCAIRRDPTLGEGELLIESLANFEKELVDERFSGLSVETIVKAIAKPVDLIVAEAVWILRFKIEATKADEKCWLLTLAQKVGQFVVADKLTT